jgi:hypothetical protein
MFKTSLSLLSGRPRKNYLTFSLTANCCDLFDKLFYFSTLSLPRQSGYAHLISMCSAQQLRKHACHVTAPWFYSKMKLKNEGAIRNHGLACDWVSKDLLNIFRYVFTGLQWSQWPLACRNCGFESHWGMNVSCECCVLFRGPCVRQATRPEEFYRVWFVWLWSWNLNNKEPWPTRGCRVTKKDIFFII